MKFSNSKLLLGSRVFLQLESAIRSAFRFFCSLKKKKKANPNSFLLSVTKVL